MTRTPHEPQLPDNLPAVAAKSFSEARDSRPVPAADLQRDAHSDLPGGGNVTTYHLTVEAARRPAWTDSLTTVETITCDTAQPRQHPLLDVATARRSATPNRPADLPRLLTLLAHIGTVHRTGHDSVGRQWSSGLVPSAGGTHSTRALLHTTEPDDKWFVVPASSKIINTVTARQVNIPPKAAADIQSASNACTPTALPACLYLVADTARLFARYPHGTSLLWRDAGAFAATAHLLAAEFGLDSVILGCGGQLLNDDPFPAVLVGAVAVGATATTRRRTPAPGADRRPDDPPPRRR